ncbi:MAG: hypothetical protein OEM59_02245 [Rhodospirillales bacterium]|nr:hypothetical protein [Rhodospirillales bacterium]
MGLFDLAAPLFEWLDARLASLLGDYARLLLWAALGAVLSMLIYALTARSAAIAEVKRKIAALRNRLLADAADLDKPFDLGEVVRLLGLSLTHVRLTLKPALLASLPLLFLLAWVSNSFGYLEPRPGTRIEAVVVDASPPGNAASRRAALVWPAGEAATAIIDGSGAILARIEPGAPAPVLHKRVWWNTLFGNPLGYLPQESDIERVELSLQPRHFLDGYPNWLSGWEASFFAVLVLLSVAIKFAFRIH